MRSKRFHFQRHKSFYMNNRDVSVQNTLLQWLLTRDCPRWLICTQHTQHERKSGSECPYWLLISFETVFQTERAANKCSTEVWGQANTHATAVYVLQSSNTVVLWCNRRDNKRNTLDSFPNQLWLGKIEENISLQGHSQDSEVAWNPISLRNEAVLHWSADLQSYLNTRYFSGRISESDPLHSNRCRLSGPL